MVREIVAPNTVFDITTHNSDKVFIAGGITGCRDWQQEFVGVFKEYHKGDDVVLYNPRRSDYNIDDEEEQITWEYKMIDDSDIVAFWFSSETVQPITLFELGKVLGSGQRVIIGIDPEYPRMNDVKIQSQLSGYKYGFPETVNLLATCVTFLLKEEV